MACRKMALDKYYVKPDGIVDNNITTIHAHF